MYLNIFTFFQFIYKYHNICLVNLNIMYPLPNLYIIKYTSDNLKT